MSIKNGIFEVLGKTVKEIIVNEGCGPYPEYHLFLVFDDDSYYEFYGGGHINSAGGLGDDAIGYAKVFSSCSSICRYRKDAKGKCITEELVKKASARTK